MSLRRSLRSLAYRHVGGSALVLLYHRVADLERDPQLLSVTPKRFDEQMRAIASKYQVVSVADLAQGLKQRKVPDRSVVITFDDGYADNALTAEPILAEHRVPGTVYVSSGYVDGDREFWWDELENLILSPSKLPFVLNVEVAGQSHSWSVRDESDDSIHHGDDGAWNVLLAAENDRQRLYLSLSQLLRPLSAGQREDLLAQVREWAGIPPHVRSTHRPLSEIELRQLSRSDFLGVGGHTVSHQVLSASSASEQRTEIEADKAALARMLGAAPTSFSYPYGGLDDYSETSVSLVRESGYESACSNHQGLVKPWTDVYRIPRHVVRDWTGEELIGYMEDWFNA